VTDRQPDQAERRTEERGPDGGGEREPDHTEDPRRQDTGNQVPEQAPAEQTGDGGGGGRGGDPSSSGGSGRSPEADAPDTSGDRSANQPGAAGEGDQSTGNPSAAG